MYEYMSIIFHHQEKKGTTPNFMQKPPSNPVSSSSLLNLSLIFHNHSKFSSLRKPVRMPH